jgi:hypothetical protein
VNFSLLLQFSLILGIYLRKWVGSDGLGRVWREEYFFLKKLVWICKSWVSWAELFKIMNKIPNKLNITSKFWSINWTYPQNFDTKLIISLKFWCKTELILQIFILNWTYPQYCCWKTKYNLKLFTQNWTSSHNFDTKLNITSKTTKKSYFNDRLSCLTNHRERLKAPRHTFSPQKCRQIRIKFQKIFTNHKDSSSTKSELISMTIILKVCHVIFFFCRTNMSPYISSMCGW